MNLSVLLTEAITVGLFTVVLGYLVVYVMKLMKLKLSREVSMGLALFIIGMLIHIICEFTGINKWYCKNGHACSK